MAKHFLLACLACLATTAQAVPFTNAQFTTQTVASAEAAADFQSDASPPTSTPIISQAVAIGATTDTAIAAAFAAPGLLNTSAQVEGVAGVASAVGTSTFSGDFVTGDYVDLKLTFFDVFAFASGSGFAQTSLFVLLQVGGTTLVSDLFTTPGALQFLFPTVAGSLGHLDLSLTSEASAFGGIGSGASSQGTVQFELPLPATWWLMLIGLAAFGMIRAGSAHRHARGLRGPFLSFAH